LPEGKIRLSAEQNPILSLHLLCPIDSLFTQTRVMDSNESSHTVLAWMILNVIFIYSLKAN